MSDHAPRAGRQRRRGPLVQDQKTQRQIAQINPRQPRKARPVAVGKNLPGRGGEVMTPVPFISRHEHSARRRMGARGDHVEAFPQSFTNGDELDGWPRKFPARPRERTARCAANSSSASVCSGFSSVSTWLMRRRYEGRAPSSPRASAELLAIASRMSSAQPHVHFQSRILFPRPPRRELPSPAASDPKPAVRDTEAGTEVIQKRAARDAAAAAPVQQLTQRRHPTAPRELRQHVIPLPTNALGERGVVAGEVGFALPVIAPRPPNRQDRRSAAVRAQSNQWRPSSCLFLWQPT